MTPVPNPTSLRRRVSLRAVAAVSVLVCAAALLGHEVARGATAAAVPAATFRDPANDVRAGDVDLRAISVGKQNGDLVVRFTVRRPITDNVSYTASVRSGAGSWASSRGEAAGSTPSCSTTSRSGGRPASPEPSRGAPRRSGLRSRPWAGRQTRRSAASAPTSGPSRSPAGSATPTVPRTPGRRSASASPIAARGRNGARHLARPGSLSDLR